MTQWFKAAMDVCPWQSCRRIRGGTSHVRSQLRRHHHRRRIAGLSCAAYLARAGKQTLVFEQHTQPGGYWTSFVRRGVVFDITPYWTIAPGTVNAVLAAHDVAPLEFEPHAHVGRYLGPRPDWELWVSQDRARFEASVFGSFPTASPSALARLMDLSLEVFGRIEAAPILNLELLNPAARLAAHLCHKHRTHGRLVMWRRFLSASPPRRSRLA